MYKIPTEREQNGYMNVGIFSLYSISNELNLRKKLENGHSST